MDFSDLEKVELVNVFFSSNCIILQRSNGLWKVFTIFLLLQKRPFFKSKWDTLFDPTEVSNLQLLTIFTKCVFFRIFIWNLFKIQVTYAILCITYKGALEIVEFKCYKRYLCKKLKYKVLVSWQKLNLNFLQLLL